MRDRLVNANQILMLVRILFFGVLKDLAGQGGESLDLPENSTLGDVLSHYEARIPRLKELASSEMRLLCFPQLAVVWEHHRSR